MKRLLKQKLKEQPKRQETKEVEQLAQLGYRDLYREIVLARTDYILRTHLVHEKANRSDAHNTLGLERAVLLMASHD